MNNQEQPGVQSGAALPFLDGTNDHLFFSRGFWNKIIAVARGVVNTRDWQVTENGLLLDLPAGGGGAVDFGNEWDPAKSYAAKVVVFFTPDGGSAGTYISLQAVTPGISPDTGSPNWVAFPNSPPGMWG